MRVVIIGGGLTGLVAARRTRQRWPLAEIVVLEASERWGGILRTDRIGEFRVECSADMFTTDPGDAIELIESLGKSSQLVATKPVRQRAFVAIETGIEPVPAGFSLMAPHDLDAIRASKILDASGLEGFLDERNVPPRTDNGDEDVQSFAVRRFGQQAFDRLIQPLVSGIYTADPTRLSMNATMKRFVEMERTHGSLIVAAEQQRITSADTGSRNASGARYDLFRAPVDGMGALIDWIVEDLVDVKLLRNWPVDRLIPDSDARWMIHSHSSSHEPVSSDAVVIATGPAWASKILNSAVPELAEQLGRIPSASAAVVALAFDQAQFLQPFDAFGIVVPSILQRKLIAASFTSNKFPGRAPAGKTIIRCFFGGALQRELVDLDDATLVELATNELGRLININGRPELSRVYRWRNAMPQYHVGHLDRVASIDQLVADVAGLELAGNGYRGVGIPLCIRSANEAVERLER